MRQQNGSSELARTAALIAVIFVLVFVVTQSVQAQTLTVVYKFMGVTDGQEPLGAVLDVAGTLYGTTVGGGGISNCNIGCGTVFKVDTSGKETILYRFTGMDGDGGSPTGDLVRDAASNLYGTTTIGGLYGYGTVFKLDPTAKETVLHSFAGGTDGKYPSGVQRDAAGNLYGTTGAGGTGCGGFGCGTVFIIDTAGTEKVLYSFTGIDGDGANPRGGLARDVAGNLYGVTGSGGGTGCGGSGCGTIFAVDPSGRETVMYRFAELAGDGGSPNGYLLRDEAGNLYGTTANGGAFFGGTVFKLDATGKETILYSFKGGYGDPDGGFPSAGLVRDAAGNFYGTTQNGGGPGCGGSGCGTVFKLDKSGTETVLYSFPRFGGPNGNDPDGRLAWDAAGNLYGTTLLGGKPCAVNPAGCGTVFRITP